MNKILGVQTTQHTFKGTANKPGPDWSIGFDQGRQFALDNFNPNTGGYNRDLPTLFNPRADDYNSGFTEGLLSGQYVHFRYYFWRLLLATINLYIGLTTSQW